MFALSPALFVTATVNWDLLAIALAVVRHLAPGRGAGRWPPGVLLGLGAAAKLWPLFILVAAARPGHADPAAAAGRSRSGVAGVLTWVAVNVPVDAGSTARTGTGSSSSTASAAIDWGTLWYIGAPLPAWRRAVRAGAVPVAGQPHPGAQQPDVRACSCWPGSAIGALVLLAPRRPRLAQLAFLVVAAFLIFSKVWSQQFVLWLLPLVVLARPRWGAFLAWQVAEICYFVAFYGELMGASGKPVFPEWVFVLASSLRLVTVASCCACWWSARSCGPSGTWCGRPTPTIRTAASSTARPDDAGGPGRA